MKLQSNAEKSCVDKYIIDCTIDRVLRLLILFRTQKEYESFESFCESVLKSCYTDYERAYKTIENDLRKKNNKKEK